MNSIQVLVDVGGTLVLQNELLQWFLKRQINLDLCRAINTTEQVNQIRKLGGRAESPERAENTICCSDQEWLALCL